MDILFQKHKIKIFQDISFQSYIGNKTYVTFLGGHHLYMNIFLCVNMSVCPCIKIVCFCVPSLCVSVSTPCKFPISICFLLDSRRMYVCVSTFYFSLNGCSDKITYFAGVLNNPGLDPFQDPVGHFGAPQQPILILQAVSMLLGSENLF